MISNTYPFVNKGSLEEKITYLREKNLPFLVQHILTPLKQANLLVTGSGDKKTLNETKIREYRTTFALQFKMLLDLKDTILKKYGEKSKEYSYVYTLLNYVIKINQQLPKMSPENVIKKSLFSGKSDLTPAIKVRGNIVSTVQLYEKVLSALSR